MKIITYSDLHLEFGRNFQHPAENDADVMILAGDIITFRNFEPLGWMLKDWPRPVLFVAGNHEYYTQRPMDAGESAFKAWLAELIRMLPFYRTRVSPLMVCIFSAAQCGRILAAQITGQ